MSSLKVNAKIIAYLVKRRARRWLLRRSWGKGRIAFNGSMGTIGQCLLVLLLLYGLVACSILLSSLWVESVYWWSY